MAELKINHEYIVKINAKVETELTDEEIEALIPTLPEVLKEMIIEEITDGVGTVEVADVVRCKDCKSYSGKYCTLTDDTEDRREPNDYCSCGERKEGRKCRNDTA